MSTPTVIDQDTSGTLVMTVRWQLRYPESLRHHQMRWLTLDKKEGIAFRPPRS